MSGEDLVATRKKGLVLSKTGRARMAAFLGDKSVKTTVPWREMKDEYLMARALGIPSTRPNRKRIARIDGLVSEIVRQAYSLDLDPAPKMTDVREALLWKLLMQGASPRVVGTT